MLISFMTTSLNGGDPIFDIERYAAKHRGGGTDNMFIGDKTQGGNESRFKQLTDGANDYETSLPYPILFENTNEIKILGNTVRLDEFLSNTRGSGGSYLSNEVMYRSTRLRDQLKMEIPVGHFHLGNLNSIQKNDIVTNIIKAVIKRLL